MWNFVERTRPPIRVIVKRALQMLWYFAVASLVSAKVYLEHLQYPINAQPNVAPLRGVVKGDIWGPPVKGANKVRCGQFGADDYLGDRIKVKPKQPFSLTGVVGDPSNGGKLVFEAACEDENPNFDLSGILFWAEKLSEYPVPKQEAAYGWRVELTMSENYIAGPCTIQVTYSPEDPFLPNHYQCVDIELLARHILTEDPAFWGVGGFLIVTMVVTALCLYNRRCRAKKSSSVKKVAQLDSVVDKQIGVPDKQTQEALSQNTEKHDHVSEKHEKSEHVLSEVPDAPEDQSAEPEPSRQQSKKAASIRPSSKKQDAEASRSSPEVVPVPAKKMTYRHQDSDSSSASSLRSFNESRSRSHRNPPPKQKPLAKNDKEEPAYYIDDSQKALFDELQKQKNEEIPHSDDADDNALNQTATSGVKATRNVMEELQEFRNILSEFAVEDEHPLTNSTGFAVNTGSKIMQPASPVKAMRGAMEASEAKYFVASNSNSKHSNSNEKDDSEDLDLHTEDTEDGDIDSSQSEHSHSDRDDIYGSSSDSQESPLPPPTQPHPDSNPQDAFVFQYD